MDAHLVGNFQYHDIKIFKNCLKLMSIFINGKDEWIKKYDIYSRCSNVAVQCEDAQMYWSTLRWPIIDADHGIALTTLKAGYDTFLWGVFLYQWNRRSY